MKSTLSDRKHVVAFTKPGAAVDITHKQGTRYRLHRDRIQQVISGMISTGKEVTWAEARLRNSGLFETEGLCVRLLTARSAQFEGTALLTDGTREHVKACFEGIK